MQWSLCMPNGLPPPTPNADPMALPVLHCSSLLITAHSLRSNANSSSPCHGAAPLVCSPTGQSTTTPRSQVHSPLTRPCRCCCTPRLPLVGVSIGMERGRQQNDTCTRRSQPSPPSWRRSFGRITTGQHPTHPRHATPRHTLCTCPCPPAHAVMMSVLAVGAASMRLRQEHNFRMLLQMFFGELPTFFNGSPPPPPVR